MRFVMQPSVLLGGLAFAVKTPDESRVHHDSGGALTDVHPAHRCLAAFFWTAPAISPGNHRWNSKGAMSESALRGFLKRAGFVIDGCWIPKCGRPLAR